MRFFISYTTSDGEDFAHRAKAILSAHGHEAWVWKTDHTPGVGTWQEIANEILARDILLCVVTSASLTSDAQRREVNLALNRGKRITALKHVDTEILPELSGQNYERFSEDEFDTVCRSVATRVDLEATSSTDPALLAITKHHRFIQELRAQVHGLNPDVLALANREAQESYLASTLPRQLVRFASQTAPSQNFQVISLEESRRLDTFNDPSYIWDMYFRDTGRAVASGEKRELTNALVNARDVPTIEVGPTENRFAILDGLIEELAMAGTPPQSLLAPVGDLPAFYKFFGNRATWSSA